jgi:DNA-binding transcriptional regulator YiaG
MVDPGQDLSDPAETRSVAMSGELDIFSRHDTAKHLVRLVAQSGLSAAECASKLNTPKSTFGRWLRDDNAPPGCLAVLVDVLERFPEVREHLGINL